MKGLTWVITALVITVILSLTSKRNKKLLSDNVDKELVIIKIPAIFKIITVIGGIFFLAIGIWAMVDNSIIAGIVMAVVAILFLITGVLFNVWKIELYRFENRIVITTMFSNKYDIKLNEIKYFTHKDKSVMLYTENKKFYVDGTSENLELLIDVLNENNVEERK